MKRKLEEMSTLQMQQLVRVAEKCLENERILKSPVLETFGQREGVDILRRLFGSPKTFVLDKASTSEVKIHSSYELSIDK